MDRILTIIVTYNGMKWLDKCLSSVRESKVKSDLFIVDNGSTDGTTEYIKKNYPEAVLVESEENLGFGKANNKGFEYALKNGYDYVYLLNQDAWIEPNLLGTMIDTYQSNPDFGILSPLQITKRQTNLDKNFSECIPPTLSSDLLCGQPLKKVYSTHFAMAAHWLIPVEILRKIGGFSPIFPHYGEDDNLIDRCKYIGYKIGIVPEVKGVHDREYRKDSEEKIKYMRYISILKFLNNPLYRNKFLTLAQRLISYSIRPNQFTAKYAWLSIKAYFKSKVLLKKYLESECFLK